MLDAGKVSLPVVSEGIGAPKIDTTTSRAVRVATRRRMEMLNNRLFVGSQWYRLALRVERRMARERRESPHGRLEDIC